MTLTLRLKLFLNGIYKERGVLVAIISIIVPVYNAEKYLARCIDSILCQTFGDFELILVNDGSSDKSKEICEKYSESDPRIKLINQENSGVSATRNAGLDSASGEYIGFVDSDDFIEKNMYEELYNILKKTGADISVCGIKDVYSEETGNFQKIENKVLTFDAKSALECILSGKLLTMYSVNKLYKKELFENLRYPVGKIYEDTVVSVQIFSKCSRIAYSPAILYYYFRNSGSITFQKFSMKDMDIIDSGEFVFDFIKKVSPNLMKAAQYRRYWSYLYVLDKMVLCGINKNDREYYKIKKFVKKNIWNIISNPYFSFKRKLGALIITFNEGFYTKMILKNFSKKT